MDNPFIRKLEFGAKLTDEDRALLALVSRPTRLVPARRDIIGEGDPPSDVHLVMEGIACRYKLLPDGKRQIIALFLPGDICDLHVQILGWMDHSIGTLTECRLAALSPDVIDQLTANPRINRALWWSTLVDEGTLREWLVNMGQRSADRQIAHLLCELLFRFRLIGQADHNTFPLPLTQEELADTTGLTQIHVNRMLRDLRERGLIVIAAKRISVPDVAALADYCDFNDNHLHTRDPRTKRGAAEPRFA
ncbi:Crp/Fnr family transcriptional regulator [Sphingomonas sp. NBWT7]|uniref:Crp/Fnr family transcriptional regulator n=1 Tax=Sphingomonas sp. NBWT7 TaxID=2596913 RepID=UPI0016279DBA|nr:Crp/Fnr family transcriptional regulator [Sphingomonas sp. NBWT7]QNE33012.1 Crp/Fnr family transcriptional regulator [Sphingomonas sp. NBWT7]